MLLVIAFKSFNEVTSKPLHRALPVISRTSVGVWCYNSIGFWTMISITFDIILCFITGHLVSLYVFSNLNTIVSFIKLYNEKSISIGVSFVFEC